MNIPNVLTTIRFFIVPVFGYYLIMKNYTVAVVLFLAAGLTDILDGYIARRFNMTTKWGKLADPLADKLTQLTALVILTYQNRIPLIVTVIVCIKEIMMVTGSAMLYRKDIVVGANWYGKLATVIFYFAIIMVVFNGPFSEFFVWVAIASTLFALLRYSMEFVRIKKMNS